MSSPSTKLLDKFMGSMVGAVIGDALGSPLEFITENHLSYQRVRKQFQRDKDNVDMRYTDDTAMARQVAASLIDKKGFCAKDMAEKFVAEYLAEPHRGYGRGVVDVFANLHEEECRIPFGPAEKQFGGSGSYGNGGSMRVHPVALFSFAHDVEFLVQLARNSAKITHSHRDAYNGAILQAYAVYLALQGIGDNKEFVQKLQNLVRRDDFNSSDGKPSDFVDSLAKLESCLSQKDDNEALALGNDISALKSVPSAIYSFLRVRDSDIEGLDQNNKFTQTIQFAYSFGGDTDTIGSMAGAIAGAFYGLEKIPKDLVEKCEGTQFAKIQAEELYQLVQSKINQTS